MDTSASSPISTYLQYLKLHCPTFEPASLVKLQADLNQTQWDNPQTALDFNNLAVITLIEAEQAESGELRTMGLEMALEALTQAAEMQPSHPLAVAHLALVHSLLGESEAAIQTAFPVLLNLLQYAYAAPAVLPLGLVYLPLTPARNQQTCREAIQQILSADTGAMQALRLLVEVLNQAQLVFYNPSGKRFLQLSAQLVPDSVMVNLKLGLAHLMQQQWEGLLNLQQARAMAPEFAPVVQALYLAYRQLQPEVSTYWLQYGRDCALSDAPDASAWQWTRLEPDSRFTYLPFQSLLMAVDPSLNSIVTSVLLAEGDWFEAEMEFWRTQLQPGMTVIDVGANVGVYTFSAAQQVGATGRVLAIEPFSGCVNCLEETRRLNHLDWVKVCAGAASDREGSAKLSLQASSELNEVIMGESAGAGEFEEVRCFSLDSLIESENLERIDWLKIDAEGHEMQVLAGSEQILTRFAPSILYENIAGAGASNTPVAEYLQAQGYRLFRYQPYLQNLIPIESVAELQGNLNVIALPRSRSD
jgi:FkbM family methyltransferase